MHYVEVRPENANDRFTLYKLGQHYDVIVIGDLSAQQFSLENTRVFERIKEMVEKENTGLLMLGGSETFAMGGWKDHPSFMSLLPVDFNAKGKKPEFLAGVFQAQVVVPWKGLDQYPFLKLDVDGPKNTEFWAKELDALQGLAPVGEKVAGSSELLRAKDEPLMLATAHGGRVAVFAGDSTAESWFGSEKAIAGFTHFWKHLVFWLAQHEEQGKQLWVKLDKRRMTTDPADVLSFTAGVRGKDGADLAGAKINAKVFRGNDELPNVRIARAGKEWRGSFQGAKEPGEYRLEVTAIGVPTATNVRFLVATDDIETLRPVAEHETLSRLASSAEGRFHPAQEEAFLQYLEELQGQVNRESRHKTTHWPDWNRVPAPESTRDQLSGLWNSFALAGMLLFVALLGSEWLLRRWWGLV